MNSNIETDHRTTGTTELPDVQGARASLATNPSAPQTAAEFDAFCARLKDVGIFIREQQWNGPRTVLFFTDIHEVPQALLVYDKLRYCGSLAQFDVLGMEGLTDAPESATSQRIRKTAFEIMQLEPVEMPVVSASGEVTGITNSVQVYWSFFDARFATVPGMEKARVVGIESNEELLIRGRVIVGALTRLGAIIDEVKSGGGAVVMHRRGENAPYYTAMMHCLEFLSDYNVSAPALTLDCFAHNRNSGEFLVDRRHLPLLQLHHHLLERLLANDNAVRNADCVAKLDSLTLSQTASLSALIFGAAHSVDDPRLPAKSIQRHLSELGMSYAIIDPYLNIPQMVRESIDTFSPK